MDNELYHYGVKGMKWGVRKEEYRSMNRKQRKTQRDAYRKTPEGRIKRATTIGTVLGGPIVGSVAGLIASKRINKNTKVSDLPKKTIDKGKKKVDDLINNETDEQKIMKLVKEGQIDLSKRDYVFDQNGNLMYVGFKE